MSKKDNRRSFLKQAAVSGLGVTVLPGHFLLPSAAAALNTAPSPPETHPPKEAISCWLASSLKRVFPQTPAEATGGLEMVVARNSRVAFQACYHNNGTSPKNISCDLASADTFTPVIRHVGLVPMRHFTPDTVSGELDGTGSIPGLVPDPLFPQTKATADPFESRSFWITLNIPSGIAPGMHDIAVRLSWDDGRKEKVLPVKLHVSRLALRPRENFHVIHWWRGGATWDYYKTEMFDNRWWQLTRAQMADLLDHGTDVAYTPLLFDRKEIFKRPCQLLVVDEPSPGQYRFDWSRVKRFTDMCKAIGFKKFEWTHMWIYWGVKHPMRVYTEKDGRYVMLWPPDISGFSDTYLNFLSQFLPAFHRFLLKENILQDSYFHLSDEPGDQDVENYRKARQILHRIAPWMKVTDALSNIKYGREHLTDIPVPLISAAEAYRKENIPHWVYYCTVPRGSYLNRFFDTPLPKIRMAGWLFYHLKAEGFLHWGYNYWHKVGYDEILDPFTNGDGGCYPGIPYGDPFVVYPGKEGPLSSVRWEVFAESLQDYAMLQSAGIDPDDAMFSDLHNFGDFPKTEDWLDQTLNAVLKK
ncbi:MAG TPA: DUF4091 domain-containing protein [Chitinophagaceae bacterium]|nr:DUF4091 domain-containing protein [Chitinophagaceae bacterium]